MAQTNGPDKSKTDRRAKTHQDFWKDRLVRRSYADRDGRAVEMPEWHVRIASRGRRGWFNLGTANQAAAAVKARDIHISIVAVGWGATLVKFKPSMIEKADCCTVGEFLADVSVRSHLKPVTVRRYAVKLLKIVSDVTKLEAKLNDRAKRTKYDHVNGGHKAWIAKVDGQRLDVLTPETINAWRNSYVAKAGSDPMKRKSAERSAASCMRCARSLFTADVLPSLKVKLPPNPFAGVKLKDPGAQRYHSEVSAEWLLACAERELRTKHPQQYLALFLCLWAGLRRKEADLLTWVQIDFGQGQISIRRTAHFEPKTDESQRVIDFPLEAVNVLRTFKKGSKSESVMAGAQPNPASTYDYYRCDCTWRDLHDWLRSKGVRQKKAVRSSPRRLASKRRVSILDTATSVLRPRTMWRKGSELRSASRLLLRGNWSPSQVK